MMILKKLPTTVGGFFVWCEKRDMYVCKAGAAKEIIKLVD